MTQSLLPDPSKRIQAMLKQSLRPFRAALIAVAGRTLCVADPVFLVRRGRNTARGDRSQGD